MLKKIVRNYSSNMDKTYLKYFFKFTFTCSQNNILEVPPQCGLQKCEVL